MLMRSCGIGLAFVLCCQIPSNTYLIVRALNSLSALSGLKLVTTWCVMALQLIIEFSILMFFAQSNLSQQEAHKSICALQGELRGHKWAIFKLKYLQLYERLNSNKKLRVQRTRWRDKDTSLS